MRPGDRIFAPPEVVLDRSPVDIVATVVNGHRLGAAAPGQVWCHQCGDVIHSTEFNTRADGVTEMTVNALSFGSVITADPEKALAGTLKHVGFTGDDDSVYAMLALTQDVRRVLTMLPTAQERSQV